MDRTRSGPVQLAGAQATYVIDDKKFLKKDKIISSGLNSQHSIAQASVRGQSVEVQLDVCRGVGEHHRAKVEMVEAKTAALIRRAEMKRQSLIASNSAPLPIAPSPTVASP